MEAFYYLDNAGRTLEERRRLLKAAQIGSGKVDIDRLRRIIKVYADVDCDFEFINELNIILHAGNKVIHFTDFTDILGSSKLSFVNIPVTITDVLSWRFNDDSPVDCISFFRATHPIITENFEREGNNNAADI